MRRKEALEFRPLRGRCRPEAGAPRRRATRAAWRLPPRGRAYRAAKNRWIRPTPSSITASEVA